MGSKGEIVYILIGVRLWSHLLMFSVPGSSKFIDPLKQEQCLKYTNGSVCLPYLNPSRNIYSSHGLPSLQMLENTLKGR